MGRKLKWFLKTHKKAS